MSEQDLTTLKRQVNEMYTALVGNGITKDGGLVEQVRAINVRQKEQDERLKKFETALVKLAIYMKLVWASAGSVATAIFSLIIKK